MRLRGEPPVRSPEPQSSPSSVHTGATWRSLISPLRRTGCVRPGRLEERGFNPGSGDLPGTFKPGQNNMWQIPHNTFNTNRSLGKRSSSALQGTRGSGAKRGAWRHSLNTSASSLFRSSSKALCCALRQASSSSSITSKRDCSIVLPTRTSNTGCTSLSKSNNCRGTK
ncbi:hypothetical protein EYF80_013667 [Liparis tanakae]|uniref:Uncharacterized protein n=1 Tax=Liparis tanakae TaxID=230148 RepID=A0A4Z2IDU6_9TELE|nr:hypothetical protein EYF80_013667 [Liparis tanakae]